MKQHYILLTIIILAIACLGCGKKTTDFPAKVKSINAVQATLEPHHRWLGNTGIQVNEIGLGCGGFEDMTKEEARQVMDSALAHGANYIDIYDANPTVRDNIGYALQGRRDQMNIQGHIGSYWNGTQYERTRDVSKCKLGFEDLLARLGTDHVEVGMIHIVDNQAEWDSIKNSPYMDYVKQLKAEGKIKHIGVSSHNAAVAYEVVKSGLVEVLMLSINPAFDLLPSDLSAWDPASYAKSFTNIDATRTQLYNYCEEKGIGLVVMKAFGGGDRLLNAKQSPLGVTLSRNQCLHYALSRPATATVVCSPKNMEVLLDCFKYQTASDSEKDYSTVLSDSKKACWKGDCIYCGHCAPCPVDIDIDRINKLLAIAKMYDEGSIPQEIRDAYDKLAHHAGECIECGACESRCPFGVPVRENMKEAKRIFGK